MSIVLAALDTTAAARPVLETAVRIGQLTGADVEALHVQRNASESFETPEWIAARMEVPFRLMEGPVEPALLDALGGPEVIAAVLGARSTRGGRRPVGNTARHILEHADKPIVIVPPDAVSPGAFQRLLLPLEGTEALFPTSAREVVAAAGRRGRVGRPPCVHECHLADHVGPPSLRPRDPGKGVPLSPLPPCDPRRAQSGPGGRASRRGVCRARRRPRRVELVSGQHGRSGKRRAGGARHLGASRPTPAGGVLRSRRHGRGLLTATENRASRTESERSVRDS